MEAAGAVDAQNAPTAPRKTLRVFHELPQGLSHQVPHTNVCTIQPPAGQPRRGKRLRMCSCPRISGEVVYRSVDGRLRGPRFGWGPARRQPCPHLKVLRRWHLQATNHEHSWNAAWTFADVLNRWAEPSLTVQPLGTGRPLAISAVYRGPDFPRACSSSPDTDGVLQPRKSMTMLDLLAMEPAKAAPNP